MHSVGTSSVTSDEPDAVWLAVVVDEQKESCHKTLAVRRDTSASTGSDTTRKPKRRVRWIAVAYYGMTALFGLWLVVSVTVHLFGSKTVMAAGSAIDPKANNPRQLHRCWSEVDDLFRSLVTEFGRQVASLARYRRNLRQTWGGRFGWDLLPMDQIPASRLDEEHLGSWRWRLLRVRQWCRLEDSDVTDRSQVLALLSQAASELDPLRVSLTRRMHAFVDSGGVALPGGEQAVIGKIRTRIGKARRLLVKRFGGRLPAKTGIRFRP